MKKAEYIEKYIKNVKRKLNGITDVYDFSGYVQCDFCPIVRKCSQDGHCIIMLHRSIDNFSEVEE